MEINAINRASSCLFAAKLPGGREIRPLQPGARCFDDDQLLPDLTRETRGQGLALVHGIEADRVIQRCSILSEKVAIVPTLRSELSSKYGAWPSILQHALLQDAVEDRSQEDKEYGREDEEQEREKHFGRGFVRELLGTFETALANLVGLNTQD